MNKCDECKKEFNPDSNGAKNECGQVCAKKRKLRDCDHLECKGKRLCLFNNVVNKNQKGSSIRVCKNCGKNNPHTISCHVIPEAIENLREGVIRDNGGTQRFSATDWCSLIETRVSKGKFWCNSCETDIGGIDDKLVPLLKKIANQIVNINESVILIDINEIEILIQGMRSILKRHILFSQLQGLSDVDKLNNIRIYGVIDNKTLGVLMSIFIRVNIQNEIRWDYMNKHGELIFHFSRNKYCKIQIY